MLEVLVVILVIGLFVGLTSLVQGDTGGQQARREAEQLRGLIGLLREDALLNRQAFGLRIDPERYQVLRLDEEGTWQPAPGYREQRLPDSLRLRLELDDETAGLGDAGRRPMPQLLVQPSDEVSPFTLLVEYRMTPVLSLASDGLEEVRLEPVEP